MGYFPFFMNIAGKNGVVVGGGKVAARKVEKLLPFGPNLTVIAPRIEDCIRTQGKLSDKNRAALQLAERAFETEDLTEADFVVAATDDEELNCRISDYCKENRIPVNVVDDREKCSFFFPALVREGDLTIGISTDGKSPVAASWVRKEVSRMLPPGIGDAIDLLGQIRPQVMELEVPEAERKEILEKMFLYCMERNGEVTPQELERQFLCADPCSGSMSPGRRTGCAASREKRFPTRLKKIRIGTRGSRLALKQAFLVQESLLQAEDGLETEIIVVHTKGDRIQDRPLNEIGDKGVFASELEKALQDGEIDLAVHSAKDLPMTLAEGLVISAVLPRADVRDVLVIPKGGKMPSPKKQGLPVEMLPAEGVKQSVEGWEAAEPAGVPGKAFAAGSGGRCGQRQTDQMRAGVLGGKFVIGTGSRRRQQQADQIWADVVCENIRGNVDTRLRKLKDRTGEGNEGIVYDGIILAKAGLDRLEIMSRYGEEFTFHPLSPEEFLPAACQGIIAVEAVRESDAATICRKIMDAETELCFLVEREVLAGLSADCSEAAAAWCRRRKNGRRRNAVPGGKESCQDAVCEPGELFLDVMYAGDRKRLVRTVDCSSGDEGEKKARRLREGLRMARQAAELVKDESLMIEGEACNGPEIDTKSTEL